MEDLKKMYQAIEMLEELGLPVSLEQQFALRRLETDYLEQNIIPSIVDLMQTEVEVLKNKFCLIVKYDPEEGLSVKQAETKSVVKQPTIMRTDGEPYKAKAGFLRITFPDGNVVQDQIVVKTYLKAIEFAGAERVQKLGIFCGGDNLIRDTIALDEMRPVSIKRLSCGKYIQTNSNTRVKKEHLDYINEQLNLGLQIEIIEI